MTPASRLLYAIAFVGVAGIALLWLPQFYGVWLALFVFVLGVALTDIAFLARTPRPTASRRSAHSVPLGVERRIQVQLKNRARRPLRVEVFDHHPVSFRCAGLPRTLTVGATSYAEFDYRALPTERGRHRFGPVDLRIDSPLGLWHRRDAIDAEEPVNVFPNFAAVAKYTVLGVDSHVNAGGLHLRPRRGEGSEFHQLREYRVGDTFRQIDWKATARIGRLITKEYQEERDQQIVFLIDTGRRMLAREDELSHFDHVLNAMLLLSYIALRQGDAVGFLTCGDNSQWMRPRKGLSAINVISNRLFDLQPQPVAIDYQAAATELAMRQKRRALVVLLTNIRDEDSDDLKVAFRLLRRRHLLLVASLREPGVDDVLDGDVDDFDSALRFASTHHYLDSRRATHESLGGKGVIIEDTSCALLPQAIAKRYMDIKRAGML